MLASDFTTPFVEATIDAVVAAAKSWIEEVGATAHHATFVKTAAVHIDRLAQHKNVPACVSAVEALNDLLYQCIEPYLWQGGIGFNH